MLQPILLQISFSCKSYHSSKDLMSLCFSTSKLEAWVRYWWFANTSQQAFIGQGALKDLYLSQDFALDWTTYFILFGCQIVPTVEQPPRKKIQLLLWSREWIIKILPQRWGYFSVQQDYLATPWKTLHRRTETSHILIVHLAGHCLVHFLKREIQKSTNVYLRNYTTATPGGHT